MVSKYLLKVDFCGEDDDILTERTENSFLIHPGKCDINSRILGNAEKGISGLSPVSLTLLIPLLSYEEVSASSGFHSATKVQNAIINYNTVSLRG